MGLWFDKLTTNGENLLPFVLSLSKDEQEGQWFDKPVPSASSEQALSLPKWLTTNGLNLWHKPA
jgi:hypothetical protein